MAVDPRVRAAAALIDDARTLLVDTIEAGHHDDDLHAARIGLNIVLRHLNLTENQHDPM